VEQEQVSSEVEMHPQAEEHHFFETPSDAPEAPLFKCVLETKKVRVLQGDMRHVDHLKLEPDVLMIDPPYSTKVQSKSKKGVYKGKWNAKERPFPWPPLTQSQIHQTSLLAAKTRRFTVIFCDDQSSILWRKAMEKQGLIHVRQCVWHKKGASPSFLGDRPAQHHELIEVFHSPHSPVRWNGHGRGNIYVAPVVKSETDKNYGKSKHPATKPLELMKQLVEDFSNPGELVVDIFAGLGKTLLACDMLDRQSLGIEKNPKFVDRILKSMRQTSLDLDLEFPFHLKIKEEKETFHSKIIQIAFGGSFAQDFTQESAKRIALLTSSQCISVKDSDGDYRICISKDCGTEVHAEVARLLADWFHIAKYCGKTNVEAKTSEEEEDIDLEYYILRMNSLIKNAERFSGGVSPTKKTWLGFVKNSNGATKVAQGVNSNGMYGFLERLIQV